VYSLDISWPDNPFIPNIVVYFVLLFLEYLCILCKWYNLFQKLKSVQCYSPTREYKQIPGSIVSQHRHLNVYKAAGSMTQTCCTAFFPGGCSKLTSFCITSKLFEATAQTTYVECGVFWTQKGLSSISFFNSSRNCKVSSPDHWILKNWLLCQIFKFCSTLVRLSGEQVLLSLYFPNHANWLDMTSLIRSKYL
jgi:hypothetical protein